MSDMLFHGFARLEKDEVLLMLTAAKVDTQGDVIVPAGVDLSQIRRTGSVVFVHSESAPVATMTDFFLADDALWAKAQFHQKPKAWGDCAYVPLFAENYVRETIRLGKSPGVSVRITPLPGGVRNATGRDVEKYGNEVRQVVNRSRLREVSITPLPSLPDALVMDIGKSAGFSPEHSRLLLGMEPLVAAPRRTLVIPAAPQPRGRATLVVPPFTR